MNHESEKNVRNGDYRGGVHEVVENEPHYFLQRCHSAPRNALELVLQNQKEPPKEAKKRVTMKLDRVSNLMTETEKAKAQ